MIFEYNYDRVRLILADIVIVIISSNPDYLRLWPTPITNRSSLSEIMLILKNVFGYRTFNNKCVCHKVRDQWPISWNCCSNIYGRNLQWISLNITAVIWLVYLRSWTYGFYFELSKKLYGCGNISIFQQKNVLAIRVEPAFSGLVIQPDG